MKNDAPTAKLKCFVISPIGPAGSPVRQAADDVLKHLVRKALEDDYEVNRGDEDSNPGSITSTIVESILEADLIVADLSGFNPNVYYEVAVAHGYGRPTVHLQREDETPAFDLQDMRLVRYNLGSLDAVEEAKNRLTNSARYARENPTKVKTPLSGAKRFLEIETSKDPIAQSNLELVEQVRQLRAEVRRSLQGRRPRDPGPDVRGMRMVIERATKRGGLDEDDFSAVVTQMTSQDFDDWARQMLERITGEADPDTLNAVLFDEATAAATFSVPADDESEWKEGF